MRLLALLLRYGDETYPDALKQLWRTLDEAFPQTEKTVVIIDNKLAASTHRRLDDRTHLIGGDNAVFEFSGWQQGLRRLGGKINSFDALVLCTDAFRNYHGGYLGDLNDEVLQFCARKSAVVGRVEFWPRRFAVLGHEAQCWICSGFMLFGTQVLKRLDNLVSVTDANLFVSGDPANPFRKDAALSDSYRGYILGWLTGKGMSTGANYRFAFDLTAQTMDTFRRKVLSIVNEHLLTIRLQAAGVPCLDVNWLAAELRAPAAGVDLMATLEQQVRKRGRFRNNKNSAVR